MHDLSAHPSPAALSDQTFRPAGRKYLADAK